MVVYESVGVRLVCAAGYRAPVGLGGGGNRTQPSPLGWAKPALAFGPEKPAPLDRVRREIGSV
jgi:hypothetical protein